MTKIQEKMYKEMVEKLFDQFKEEIGNNCELSFLFMMETAIDTLFKETSFKVKEKVVKEYLKTL